MQPGFGETLMERCPEIFNTPIDESDSAAESEEAPQ
jgi:hypothetical protein